MKIQRMSVIRIHTLLACFFMPLAVLYFVSGALYSLHIKGNVEKQVLTITLDQPFAPDLAQLTTSVENALLQRELSLPTGSPSITEKKNSHVFRWGDLKRAVEVKPTDNPLEAELVYRERSLLTQLMRIHKAEAGLLTKIFSLSMVLSLILILATGVFLAVSMPRLRKMALYALGAGFLMVLSIFA
jgi:hypothetical protein